jgi:thiol-disulfide isomerase/thioredoxin
MPAAPLLVACLCAAWCKTCAAYRDVFAQVARSHRDAGFVWIDVEDHGDALGEAADVENFPTIVLVREGAVCFSGPLLPHAATLERLVRAAQAGEVGGAPADGSPATAAALLALARQLPAA